MFNFLIFNEQWYNHISLVFNLTDEKFFVAHNHLRYGPSTYQLVLFPSGKFMYEEASIGDVLDLEEVLGV